MAEPLKFFLVLSMATTIAYSMFTTVCLQDAHCHKNTIIYCYTSMYFILLHFIFNISIFIIIIITRFIIIVIMMVMAATSLCLPGLPG